MAAPPKTRANIKKQAPEVKKHAKTAAKLASEQKTTKLSNILFCADLECIYEVSSGFMSVLREPPIVCGEPKEGLGRAYVFGRLFHLHEYRYAGVTDCSNRRGVYRTNCGRA
jgi:hypothetical protein